MNSYCCLHISWHSPDRESFGTFDVPEYLNCCSLNIEQNPEKLDAKFMVSLAAFCGNQIMTKH
jgi:hypothetical protein